MGSSSSKLCGAATAARTSLRRLILQVLLIPLPLAGGCFSAEGDIAGVDDAGEVAGRCILTDESDRLADQVLQLINLERAVEELPPVIRNEQLDKIASDYACRMIEEDFLEHIDPLSGYGPGDRAVIGRYRFLWIGETLAAGQETPADVVKAWMDSPAHRDIILDSKWVDVGIGVREGGEYGSYWVQEFAVPAE
ncbi:MAG: CAP domain-containing protein [Planctomycetota bacterium]